MKSKMARLSCSGSFLMVETADGFFSGSAGLVEGVGVFLLAIVDPAIRAEMAFDAAEEFSLGGSGTIPGSEL